MAKMLGVPFVKADATKFSETGIVGQDAEDVIRGLIDNAGGDNEVAQYGMVYIDEIDKLTSSGKGTTGSWSGSQVQSNFLKIMEDTEVSVKNSLQSSLGAAFGGAGGKDDTISTKFMLFIFSGAFNGMNETIGNRVGKATMGFFVDGEEKEATVLKSEEGGAVSYLHLAETSDFVEAGLEPEFIGRVPVRVAIDALSADDLYKILTEAEDSILTQFENDFQGYGIKLKVEESALRRIAEIAVKEKTGARSLVTTLEKALRLFKFELPSTSCTELVVTKELIDDPKAALNALLSSPGQASADVQRWLAEVEKQFKVRIDMADDVRDNIVKECVEKGEAAESVLNRHFQATGVISGFKDIREATSGSVELFNINEAMYTNPEEEMKKWKKGLDTVS
eukprot:TRINITY_DN94903_c0_g1_i1.p1 TRINITY_DN94903_c0_g1~~TRINITY_DN94903_c0_g1_i1.p1  ORF type:complete len:463 (-),score=106.61 TRINITY_DN94903_c0_g1_i1:76-1257(-)